MNKKLRTCLLIIFSYIYSLVHSQLVADFIADSTSHCGAFIVNFINRSSGTGTLNYYWDFGNGNYSILKNPSTTYTQAGKYTVKLIVSNGFQHDTLIKQNYITVFKLPQAKFNILSSKTGCIPHTIILNNQSIEGDTTINSWKWTFGDGSITHDKNPSYIYSKQGTYIINLLVSDINGCKNTNIAIDTVIIKSRPKANFYANNTFSCNGNLNVTFTNQSSGDDIIKYKWSFGNGSTSDNINPTNFYSDTGSYNVTLVAINSIGCSDTIVKLNYIQIIKTRSYFSVPKNIYCLYDSIIPNNLSNNATQYLWSFGDGVTSSLIYPKHKYNNPGSYTIKLDVWYNNQCKTTYSKNVAIEEVVAKYSTSITESCKLPDTISFINLSRGATSWEWHFSDGTSSNEKNPILIINKNIHYFDTLIAKNLNGCRDTFVLPQGVRVNLPVAFFTPNNLYQYNPDKLKGCFPISVQFNDISVYNSNTDSIISYKWDFGDNSFEHIKNPYKIFTKIGNFKIIETITTAKGCTSTYSATVKVGSPQKPDFNIIGNTITCASNVKFINLSTDSTLIDQWRWDFGDGGIAYSKHPVHNYIKTGNIDVSLSVAYNGCWSNTLIKKDFLTILGPIGLFSYQFSCSNHYIYTYNANITEANRFYWNFGDSSYSDSTNLKISHLYNSNGDYSPYLLTINDSTQCQYKSSINIKVRNIIANITTNKDVGCEGETIIFSGKSSTNQSIFNHNGSYGYYLWSINNNTFITYSDTIKYKFLNKGIYTVRLIVTNINGCKDTAYKTIRIFKPITNFSSEKIYTEHCLPLNINFKDQTISDTTISKWLWNFGDNNYCTLQNPSHYYTLHGNYSVSLIVTDTLGCSDTLIKNNYLSISKPIPIFTINDSTICVNDTIYFNNKSLNGNTYWWNFGDNNTSSSFSPIHIYNDTGMYSVSLKVTDEIGCDSTINLNKIISVQKPPIVDFSSNITNSNCYPQLINFYNHSNSIYPIHFLWDFGDGTSTSPEQNPIHNYLIPGVYTIELIATTSNGCTASNIKKNFITIGGPYAQVIIPDTACLGEEIMITSINKKNINSWKWDLGDGSVNTNDTVFHTYKLRGKIYITILLYADTINTCDKFIKDSIYIHELSARYILKDTVGCRPFKINIINNSSGATNFLWKFTDTDSSIALNPQFTYEKSGSYTLKLIAQNQANCKDSIYNIITIYDLPNVTTCNDTIICRGKSLKLYASGGKNYLWHPIKWLSDNKTNTPLCTPDSSINYIVTVIDSNNCKNFDSIMIKVQQVPDIFMINDTSIIIGDSIKLYATSNNGNYFFWNSTTKLNCATCQQTYSKPLENTFYTLLVSDSNKCFMVEKKVYIEVLKKFTIDIPDYFTPNNDGINDIIYVKGWGIKNLISFNIFNEWGENIFSSSNLDEGWDGTYKNKPQPIGTYVYYISVKTYDEQILKKIGTFNLIR